METLPCALEAHLRPMAVRYLGEEVGNRYADGWARQSDSSLVYRMQPEHWYTVDYAT